MPVTGPVPEHEALLRELELVRENGVTALRGLNLAALHHAAVAVGLIATHMQFAPAAIEELIRQAVERFGRSRHQRAAKYTFGLVGGTRFEPPHVRRELAAKAWGVKPERFRRSQEQLILGQTAEAILALIREAVLRRAEVETRQRRPADSQSVAAVDAVAVSPARARVATIERTPTQTESSTRAGRRRHIFARVLAVALTLQLVAGGVVVALHYWTGIKAAEQEQRYDGKLPWGDDDDSGCESQSGQRQSPRVEWANRPPVVGPEGTKIGTVELHRSPICQTAVWTWVVWDRGQYTIPPGWTLHQVLHRSATNTDIPERDPPTPSQMPYTIWEHAVSRMMSTARGCVKAEVYFARDDNPDIKTPIAHTSCVRV